jgi:hypothetical protein
MQCVNRHIFFYRFRYFSDLHSWKSAKALLACNYEPEGAIANDCCKACSPVRSLYYPCGMDLTVFSTSGSGT